jgi:hypothetical protein
MISLTHDDGTVFKGENMEDVINEYNTYVANKKLKKQKEQEERAKAVAAQKAKDEAREKAMKWVTDSVDLVNQAVEKYEKETGENLTFVNVNGKLEVQKTRDGYRIGTSFLPLFFN